MKRGFVLGKFMPLHKGHLALINFALTHCDHLYIVFCYTIAEPINSKIRQNWISLALEKYRNITLIPFVYNEDKLPNTSVSSKKISKVWANELKKILPEVDFIFSSEPYGNFLSEYMNIQHVLFDEKRELFPVSASLIRQHPFVYWDFLPHYVKPWFVKKICLVGSESTGKSTLTKRLANHFETVFVPETARSIIEKTNECIYEDLKKIAVLHAIVILEKIPKTNKLLFVDTDIITTKSYSWFLFNKKLDIELWIEEANHFDLYLFLETDCEFVQDGTRISFEERIKLSENHKKHFLEAGIALHFIKGTWEERFQKAVKIIKLLF